MKKYVVLNTNVIISSLYAERSKNLTSSPFLVLNKVFNRKNGIVPLYNEEILNEYKNVLSRKKFSFSAPRIGKFINDFKKIAANIDELPEIKEDISFPDVKDIVFYQITLSKESSYLVTGNIIHFPVKPFVVTPKEYLQILDGKKIEKIRKTGKSKDYDRGR